MILILTARRKALYTLRRPCPTSVVDAYSSADRNVEGWYNIRSVVFFAAFASAERSSPNNPLSAKNVVNVFLKHKYVEICI